MRVLWVVTPTEEQCLRLVGRSQGCRGQFGAVKNYPVENVNDSLMRNAVQQQQKMSLW